MRGITRLIALLACLGTFACKQGEGERCQIDSDCESGLICGGPTDNKVCEPKLSGGNTIDAAPAPDAPTAFDAAPAADAEPAADADSVDAALPDATPAADAT